MSDLSVQKRFKCDTRVGNQLNIFGTLYTVYNKFNNSTLKYTVNIDIDAIEDVTNFCLMFRGTETFNQSLDKWNMSNVKDVSYITQLALIKI